MSVYLSARELAFPRNLAMERPVGVVGLYNAHKLQCKYTVRVVVEAFTYTHTRFKSTNSALVQDV